MSEPTKTPTVPETPPSPNRPLPDLTDDEITRWIDKIIEGRPDGR